MEVASANLLTFAADLDSLELNESAARPIGWEGRWQFIETLDGVESMIHRLFSLPTDSQALYMVIEGVNLPRHGSISLIQVWAPLWKEAFLLDIHTLGSQAFTRRGPDGKSLKDLLECEDIKKYWFDVRNDADALYALFNVRLAGVIDIQLMEVASRAGPRHLLCGMAACMRQEQVLSKAALRRWQNTKDKVVGMFDPKRGGSYEVFNIRPLPQILVDYCIGDVRLLPVLHAIYQNRLSDDWLGKVEFETARRLEEARGPNYKHQGKHKLFAPKKWRFPSSRDSRLSTKKTIPAAGAQDRPARSPVVAPATVSERLPSKACPMDSTVGSAAGDEKLRHQPIAFVAEGQKGRRKGRHRSAIGPQRTDEARWDFPEDQNWALCDKDCGWCGHCGDGIL